MKLPNLRYLRIVKSYSHTSGTQNPTSITFNLRNIKALPQDYYLQFTQLLISLFDDCKQPDPNTDDGKYRFSFHQNNYRLYYNTQNNQTIIILGHPLLLELYHLLETYKDDRKDVNTHVRPNFK